MFHKFCRNFLRQIAMCHPPTMQQVFHQSTDKEIVTFRFMKNEILEKLNTIEHIWNWQIHWTFGHKAKTQNLEKYQNFLNWSVSNYNQNLWARFYFSEMNLKTKRFGLWHYQFHDFDILISMHAIEERIYISKLCFLFKISFFSQKLQGPLTKT